MLTEKREGRFINVYIGVPNRIKKLIEVGTINITSRSVKSIIFDTNLNTKDFSIFDTYETRDDTFDILLLARKQLLKRKLKVYLA